MKILIRENNLKKLREQNKTTQEHIARLCNISLRHYQKIENGESIPNVVLGIIFSKLFNVRVEEIFVI